MSESDLLAVIFSPLAADERQADGAAALLPHAPRPLNILIVDDTPAIQSALRMVLEARGHRVRTVDNGRCAVAIVASADIDMIIMDVQMPVMNGLEATRKIRQLADPHGAGTPIVGLTSLARPEDRMRCLQAGMNVHLVKPIDVVQLITVVESVASGDAGWNSELIPLPGCAFVKPARSTMAVLDRAAALRRLGGDETLLKELAQIFIDDVPGLLQELSAALDDHSSEAAERIAHSIKGLAANFGAEDCVSRAQAIETSSGIPDLNAAASRLPGLRAAVSQVIAELHREILGVPPSA